MKNKVIAILSIYCAFPLWAARFEMKDLAQRNLVMVISDATMERTVAVSHFVSGWIEVSPDNVENISGEFELDVRTLETGLELKNLQIRDQLLSSSEFPIAKASFNVALANQKIKLLNGKPHTLKAEVTVKIQQVTKTVPVQLKLTHFKESEESRQRLTGNLLKVSANWDLDLAAFGISIPSKYSALIAKSVQISADLVGTDRLPNNALSLPEGVKKK